MDGRRGKKVKNEVRTDEGDGGACGWSEDMTSEFTRAAHAARSRLRDAAVKMADEVGPTPSSVIHATPRCTGSDRLRRLSGTLQYVKYALIYKPCQQGCLVTSYLFYFFYFYWKSHNSNW